MGISSATRFGRSGGLFQFQIGWPECFLHSSKVFRRKQFAIRGRGLAFLLESCGSLAGRSESSRSHRIKASARSEKCLCPEADWQLGDPLHLLDSVEQGIGCGCQHPANGCAVTSAFEVHTSVGDIVELADDLGNLVMVAASMRLSSSGVGLFVVTPSFSSHSDLFSDSLSDLGLGIEAALGAAIRNICAIHEYSRLFGRRPPKAINADVCGAAIR